MRTTRAAVLESRYGHRIDRRVPLPHLEVQVGTGRVAGRAHVADPRAARHLLAHVRGDLRQVRVPGREAEPVLHHYQVAVAAVVPAGEDRGPPTPAAPTRVPNATGKSMPAWCRPARRAGRRSRLRSAPAPAGRSARLRRGPWSGCWRTCRAPAGPRRWPGPRSRPRRARSPTGSSSRRSASRRRTLRPLRRAGSRLLEPELERRHVPAALAASGASERRARRAADRPLRLRPGDAVDQQVPAPLEAPDATSR